MTPPEQFAKEHLNQPVTILSTGWAGIVVGYVPGWYVAVQPFDSTKGMLAAYAPAATIFITLHPPDRIWLEPIYNIQLGTNTNTTTSYPQTCPHCKAPARKSKLLLLCSNNCSKSKKRMYQII